MRFFTTSPSRCALAVLAVVLGTVTDTTTGQPLPDVTVAIGNAHAVTSGTGAFRLTNVKPGTATMNVHSDDVPPQQFTIKVGAATTHADIKACSATLDYHCGGL